MDFSPPGDGKPHRCSICSEALASPLRTGPELSLSSPGSWGASLGSVQTTEMLGEKDLGFAQ